jgi:hypothetical protein
MIHVDTLQEPENKNDLFTRLKKEAPDFLGELVKLELPKSSDRLNVPVITTSEKIALQKQNQNALEDFLDEVCYFAPGYMVPLKDFYEKFTKWIDVGEGVNWNLRKIGKVINLPYVKGRSAKDNQVQIGNISFRKDIEERRLFVVLNGKLVTKEN